MTQLGIGHIAGFETRKQETVSGVVSGRESARKQAAVGRVFAAATLLKAALGSKASAALLAAAINPSCELGEGHTRKNSAGARASSTAGVPKQPQWDPPEALREVREGKLRELCNKALAAGGDKALITLKSNVKDAICDEAWTLLCLMCDDAYWNANHAVHHLTKEERPQKCSRAQTVYENGRDAFDIQAKRTTATWWNNGNAHQKYRPDERKNAMAIKQEFGLL